MLKCFPPRLPKTLSLSPMHRNKIIVSCLLPAYMLLVLHAIIPHHHHFSAADGPLNFHHGFNAQHQDHRTGDPHHDADSHGHTAHFVHSPEFGIAMLQPTANWIEVNVQKALPALIEPFKLISKINHIGYRSNWFPESPPLYNFFPSSVLSLRGPPASTIA